MVRQLTAPESGVAGNRGETINTKAQRRSKAQKRARESETGFARRSKRLRTLFFERRGTNQGLMEDRLAVPDPVIHEGFCKRACLVCIHLAITSLRIVQAEKKNEATPARITREGAEPTAQWNGYSLRRLPAFRAVAC